jgi:hypothetical protein
LTSIDHLGSIDPTLRAMISLPVKRILFTLLLIILDLIRLPVTALMENLFCYSSLCHLQVHLQVLYECHPWILSHQECHTCLLPLLQFAAVSEQMATGWSIVNEMWKVKYKFDRCINSRPYIFLRKINSCFNVVCIYVTDVTLKWPEKTYIDQRIFNRPVLTRFNQYWLPARSILIGLKRFIEISILFNIYARFNVWFLASVFGSICFLQNGM